MTYDECLKDMFALRRFGIKLGLDTIRGILRALDNPHEKFACIHVAGTNGKGSVASNLSSILRACGYRVGLYTSPHLVRFNERICINHQPISDQQVLAAYQAVKTAHQGTREPTFFEFATAMALYEFQRQAVDWAVIETGMGGRLDATNVVHPDLCIITNISLEHQSYLGNSIAEIAGEKGGIVKERTPVITGVTQEAAMTSLQEIAETRHSPLFRYRHDFRARRGPSGGFTYYGLDHTWRDLHTGLLGKFQVDNAAIALAGCEVLMRNQLSMPLESIRQGLAQNSWPGRLEIVSENPMILLDGAHNLIAARALANFLSENLAQRKITLIAGILDDKPYAAMLKSLLPLCQRVILTRPRIDRALSPEALLAASQPLATDVRITDSVEAAIRTAVHEAAAEDVICIAGSLYVVGEAKEVLARMRPNATELQT